MDVPGQNKMNDDESSPIFPLEVIIEILSWLPFKYLAQVQLVCKEWQAVSHEQYFIEKHMSRGTVVWHWFNVDHQHSSSAHSERHRDSFQYLHGCHGLVLLKNIKSRKYLIWNPAICLVLELPDPHDGSYGFALSYVPATKNYRVVSIYKDNESGRRGCEVFTPGHSKTWRQLEFPDFANVNKQTERKNFSVVSATGAVHCVLVIKGGKEIVAEVVTLDLETECFTVNQLPNGLFNNTTTFCELDWDGKISFADMVGQELQSMELEDYKNHRWCEKKKIVHLPFMKTDNYAKGLLFPLFAKQGDIWFWSITEKMFRYTITTGEVDKIKRSEAFSHEATDKVYPYKPSLIAFKGMVPDTNLESCRSHLRFD